MTPIWPQPCVNSRMRDVVWLFVERLFAIRMLTPVHDVLSWRTFVEHREAPAHFELILQIMASLYLQRAEGCLLHSHHPLGVYRLISMRGLELNYWLKIIRRKHCVFSMFVVKDLPESIVRLYLQVQTARINRWPGSSWNFPLFLQRGSIKIVRLVLRHIFQRVHIWGTCLGYVGWTLCDWTNEGPMQLWILQLWIFFSQILRDWNRTT